jgi:hypothetical protein
MLLLPIGVSGIALFVIASLHVEARRVRGDFENDVSDVPIATASSSCRSHRVQHSFAEHGKVRTDAE